MSQVSEYNRQVGHWRLDETTTLVTQALGGGDGTVGMTRAICPFDGLGPTDPHETEDAWLVGLQRVRMWGDVFLDGRHVPVPGRSDGNITLYDLRRTWQADFHTRFDSVVFHVPQAVLDEVAIDRHWKGPRELVLAPGEVRDDPFVRALGNLLVPAFEAPGQASALFLDHAGWALAVHMAITYGTAGAAQGAGGLAPWQERRAKEVIDADLAGTVRLAELALACGVSTGHFARAFKRTTGMAPHQWLVMRRLDRASELLAASDFTLAEVAALSGFSDQSHFTRLFRRMTGIAPGAWRRTHPRRLARAA